MAIIFLVISFPPLLLFLKENKIEIYTRNDILV